MSERTTPVKKEAEFALISCAIAHRSCMDELLREPLGHKLFFHATAQEAWVLLNQFSKEKDLDWKRVVSRFWSDGKDSSRRIWLELDQYPIKSMFKADLETARSAAQLRECIEAGGQMIAMATHGNADAGTVYKAIDEKISAAYEKAAPTARKTGIAPALHDFLEETQERMLNEGKLPGYTTGYPSLDLHTNGAESGAFWVVAGRPGGGKSAIMTQLMTNFGKAGVGVGCFSLEMTRAKLVTRIVASEANLDTKDIGRGKLTLADCQKIRRIFKKSLLELPIHIDDRPGLRVSDIETQTRKWVKDHDLKVIFVDYLQLMRSDQSHEEGEREVAAKSAALMQLAKKHGITVIALAQLNRQVEGRGGPPRNSDLRGSGSIEQDAHVILLLDPQGEGEGSVVQPVDLIISKCREGSTGTVPMIFEKQFSRFREQEHGVVEQGAVTVTKAHYHYNSAV